MNANLQKYNPWLYWFIGLTALATFLLLGAGGMVTSREAGMSVPDWPTTYGYNMFLFPVSKWIGGIFYEHTHRLLASGVGLLTTVLAVWLWLKEPRVWMRWLGLAAFILVALQGVLGGLRVTLHLDNLGIFHGALAQLFFALICAMALFTSRWWLTPAADAGQSRMPAGLRAFILATTLLIFGQLILGATMRHQHAGLAIPDFPLAYGTVWPDTGADAVSRYNAERVEVVSGNPITAPQIILQMAHRIAALAIFIAVIVCVRLTGRQLGKRDPLTRLAWMWLALIILQIALGAWTIWSNKAADIATAHVLVGALSLVTGALGCAIAFRRSAIVPQIAPAKTISGAFGTPAAVATNK